MESSHDVLTKYQLYTIIIYVKVGMIKNIKLNKLLVFEWDKGNKDKNIKKHKVQSSETEEVFLNDPIIMPDRTHSVLEERYFAFGVTEKKRELIISFTLRGENKERIRPIMARDQSKKEREYYKNQKQESEVKKRK